MTKRLTTLFVLIALAAACLALGAAPALAAPLLRIDSITNTTAAPGSTIEYNIQLTNVGDARADGTGGEPFTFTASLPPGVSAQSIEIPYLWGFFGSGDPSPIGWSCTGEGGGPLAGATTFSCQLPISMPPSAPYFDNFGIGIPAAFVLSAAVAPGLAEGQSLTASFGIEGGGSPLATTTDPTEITNSPPPFGIQDLAQRIGSAAAPQAGAHPDSVVTAIDFNTLKHTPVDPDPTQSLLWHGNLWPAEAPKDAVVDLPPGFLGVPTGFAQCTAGELANGTLADSAPLCPSDSQVGTVMVRTNTDIQGVQIGPLPLYNMVPPAGVPARFGFDVKGVVATLDATTRTGSGYGLSVAGRNLSEAIPLAGAEFTFWGTPADPIHDTQRACPGGGPPSLGGPSCPSPAPPRAFLRNPTSCAAPGDALTTAALADSWPHPGAFDRSGQPDPADPAWDAASTQTSLPTGCEEVPFEPQITIRPTTNRADSPTGLDVDLSMPQEALAEPGAIAQADVKDVSVTQPLGTRINPAAAAGLEGCSEAQVDLGSSQAPSCPEASRIGSVEIESPLLPDTLEGGIFQAKQGENPFGSDLAFYAVAEADGASIKLPAEIRTDPQTGQVTTVFRDNPQLPFDHYRLHFFGGSRGVLITPPTCGTKTTEATLTGWANPDQPVARQDSFQITQGAGGAPCPAGEGGRPFAPHFEAGSSKPQAGAFAPFALKISREDGEQELSRIDSTLPEGLVAKLAGVPYCPEAALASLPQAPGTAAAELARPSCPSASQIGILSAGSGAGPDPFNLNTGRVYLAGPYKGAPLSLAVVTPALAGPLDLGNVGVRVALHVDPETAQVHAVSDPLPIWLQGLPLDLRRLVLAIDRPNFILNPTSCEAMQVPATITALQGAVANVSDRFQVGGCQNLPFKPKLSLKLKGKTKRTGHPALIAKLRAKPGEANIAITALTLPPSEFLAQSHIRTICTRVQFAAAGGGGAGCPKGSVYGHAVARTPLLDQPLEGPVYLRANGGERELPDLVAALDGQIHIDLVGYVDSVHGGLRTRFEGVPDAPVSSFVLKMKGGAKSLLENRTNICLKPHRAVIAMAGHNGKVRSSRPPVAVVGCRRATRAR